MRKCAWAIALGLSFFRSEPASAAGFTVGDIIVSDYLGYGVQELSPSGTSLRDFTGVGRSCRGVVVPPGGNLFVACKYGATHPEVDIYGSDGTQVGSFSLSSQPYPDKMSVFPDGVLAITDSSGGVYEYTQTGTLLRTLQLSAPLDIGAAVAANDGTFWVTNEDSWEIDNYSESGRLLQWFEVPFDPYDLVVARDGSLWIGGLVDPHVYHYSPSGKQLVSFSTPLSSVEALALSPDESTVYVTEENFPDVLEYSTKGSALGTIVVPNAVDLQFITVVTPEPCIVWIMGGVIGLTLRRRNSKR
jgi:streptogramin lyase